MMDPETFSVIIPTMDRPDDLGRCVRSLAEQTEQPEEVIIVDDGDLPDELLVSFRGALPDGTMLTVTESDGPPGSSTARNTGAELANGSVCVILDDDVVLGEGYLERLASTYESINDRTLAGVGGFDSGLRSPSGIERLFNRVFGLGTEGWNVSPAGIQSWDPTVAEPTRAEWLSGNNASYRTEVLNRHRFRHWNGGREALEDVAMGWELQNNGYYCVIDPGLELEHADTEIEDSPFGFGVKRAYSRVRIFREFGDSRHALGAVRAFLGDTLRHVVAPAANQRVSYHWSVAVGMAVGFLLEAIDR
jgi:GT2 family glycosyltransferase